MTSSHLLNKDTISNVDTSLTNTDLSNLSNTGESHFQTPLVSGNNIKTINSTSLLGSGDITISAGAPTGSIMIWAGTTVPEGYLLCDGSAVSRTTYSALFSAIGTTYGAGDSSTTFNLPNMNNAKIFKTTTTTLGVRGNGKSLGLTDGSSNSAIGTVNNYGWLSAMTNGYGKNVGTTSSAASYLAINKYYGVTTSATNSGIVADLPSSVSFLWSIKY